MIGIINYGSGGNIHAFKNVLRDLNLAYIIADNPDLLETCDKIILPGVGSFDGAIKSLKNAGFFDYIKSTFTLPSEKKLFGVCVGLQVLCQGSEEGRENGLGVFDTFVRKFDVNQCAIIPHMGWNSIIIDDDPLFDGVDLARGFYFLHGYKLDSEIGGSIAHANYHSNFTCAARSVSCVGVQFHPEKSHKNGLQLIQNFLEE
jgi:imidazole glycerol-phosphate synthase subunit HisH